MPHVANEPIQAKVWHDNPDTKEIDVTPWPSGWPIPGLGHRVELVGKAMEVKVVEVQWSLPDKVVNIHVEYPGLWESAEQ